MEDYRYDTVSRKEVRNTIGTVVVRAFIITE